MTHSIKAKIIRIIFFAVTVIVATSLVAQHIFISKLYQAQIVKEIIAIVKLNVNEVNSYTRVMEQKADDLARAGEVLYRIRKNNYSALFDSEMKEYLVDNFSSFPKAVGGGIWYAPYKFYTDKKYYGPYAYWDKGEVVFTWDLSTPEYDYFTQDWYTVAIPSNWDKTKKRERTYYWTPPYIDEAGTLLQMITVDAFMYDKSGSIIGITTADWAIEQMLVFLKNSKITPDTETFLVEKNSNIIMANTLNPESTMKNQSSVAWMSLLVEPQKDVIKVATVHINNTEYFAYYTLTDAEMFYGTLVPSKTIFIPIKKLLIINLLGSVLIIILLILVLSFALSTVTNSIISLTKAVMGVAAGDLTTRIKTTSNDEIGLLGSGLNQMIHTISIQKQELEKRASTLEATVAERTIELKGKLEELEKLNTYMVDRELKMVSLKAQIKILEEELIKDTKVPKGRVELP